MSRLQLIVLVGVIATVGVGVAQVRDTRPVPSAPPPAPAGTAAISGVATSDDGSRPVRFAYVLLIGTTSGVVKVSSTDGDGKFTFSALPPDRYTVGVSKLPYIGTVAGSKRPGRPGTPIVVAAGQKVGNVSVRLPMGAVITGIITDEKGMPAASASVTLQQWRMQAGERTLVSSGFITTDERGRYRFHGLMPGEYLVGALPFSFGPTAARTLTTAEVDAALRGENTAAPVTPAAPVRYAPVFFPGTARATDATPILLATAEERQNVDFRVEAVTISRVEGTVASNDGQPLAQARVFVQSVGTPLSTGSVITVGADGRFSFTNAPGRYAVTVTGTGSQQGQFASTMLDLAGADIFGLQLLMRPTMTVNGQLAFEGRATAPSPAGRRIPFRQFGSPSVPGGPAMSVTSATGTFTLAGLVPGRYQIGGPLGFGPTADTITWALKSVLVDDTDITDRILEVSGDAAPKGVVVTYTDQFQELSGRLQSQSGAPASDYTILVFPEDKAYWIHGSRRIVTTRPGTDGKFTLSGAGPTTLPPGRYLLAAVTDLGRDEQFDPAFLGQVVPAAIPITLAAGEKKVQDLAIK
jgi:protocatechuate 3,4-dioxygenase beta subunit